MKRHRLNSTFQKLMCQKTGLAAKLLCLMSVVLIQIPTYAHGVKGVFTNDVTSTSEVITDQGQQETVRLTGKVTLPNGNALQAATVEVKGTNTATRTDANGNFSLAVTRPAGTSSTLIVSFVGYKNQEIVASGTGPYSIVLQQDVKTLETAKVSTGIFEQNRETMPGSVTVITKQDLVDNRSRSLAQTVAMLEPSFRIVENNLFGSNPNRLPEIQLRGASTFRDITDLQNNTGQNINSPLFIYDGFEIDLESFMDLNEDDIESIVILKDASSTAMYGSRGSNGVIVITPTIPIPGKIRVSYTGELNFEIPDLSTYNLTTAKQKLDLEMYVGVWDNHLDEFLNVYDDVVTKGINTNWLKYPVRTGVGQTHRISVLGGDNSLRFRANVSYNDAQGAMKGSYRKNFNGNFTVSVTQGNFHVTDALRINIVDARESPYGDYQDIALLNPYWTPRDENGNLIKYWYHPASVDLEGNPNPIPSPIYNASLASFEGSVRQVISNNLQARYYFDNGFRIEGRLSVSSTQLKSDKYISSKNLKFDNNDYSDGEKGEYTKGLDDQSTLEAAITLTYGHDFNGHTINTGVSADVRTSNSETYQVTGMGYLNDKSNLFGNAVDYTDKDRPSGSEAITRNLEFVGWINYNYQLRYFADVTLRYDGGSSFGKHSRWQEFYSLGGGWNIHNEPFFTVPIINTLRLRFNFGLTGGINFSPSQGNHLMVYDFEDFYGNWLGATLSAFGNENLSWQKTYVYDAGLDFKMWDERIEAEFAWYNKITTGGIMTMAFSPSHGYENYTGNVGRLGNKGWEAKVTASIIRNNDWLVRAGVNISANKNTVLRLSEEMKAAIENLNTEDEITSTYRYTFREGNSTEAIYTYNSPGVDPITGRRIYLDKDGVPHFDYRGLGDALIYMGDKNPKAQGTINLIAAYKGLTVSLGFSFNWGASEANQTVLDKVENASYFMNIDRRVYSDRWRQKGDRAIYKDIKSNVTTRVNSQFIQKNDTFQWTYLNVSYNLPRAFLDKYLWGVQRVNFTASMADLMYISTIRRERGLEYPFTYNPNFSISITF